MTTTTLKTLLDVHQDLLNQFNNLIDQYYEGSEEWRMKAFTKLSGEFNKIIEVEWNVIFPLLDDSEKIAAVTEGILQKRNEMVRVYELLTMIHVDEPDNLFYDRLVRVRDLFQEYHDTLRSMFVSASLTLDKNRLETLDKEFSKIFYQ
jgi:hypothetical protein